MIKILLAASTIAGVLLCPVDLGMLLTRHQQRYCHETAHIRNHITVRGASIPPATRLFTLYMECRVFVYIVAGVHHETRSRPRHFTVVISVERQRGLFVCLDHNRGHASFAIVKREAERGHVFCFLCPMQSCLMRVLMTAAPNANSYGEIQGHACEIAELYILQPPCCHRPAVSFAAAFSSSPRAFSSSSRSRPDFIPCSPVLCS